MRVALEIEFDGRQFAGSQIQAGLRTLQGELARVVSSVAGEPILPRPASRLDQGVSSEAMPVDIEISRLPGQDQDVTKCLRSLGLGLAGELPADITIRRLAVVPDGWLAQHHARAKTYRYHVWVRGTKPVLDTRCWWVRQLDHPEWLQGLADQLVGTRDLRHFACLRHDGSDEEAGARTIREAIWHDRGSGKLEFRITGDGFLYKQIRGFVGAMIHVAKGRRPDTDFSALIAGDGDIQRLGNLAPPEGLMLERVQFEPEPAWVVL
jgi:tRNA pseudouridine38-40 synthase